MMDDVLELTKKSVEINPNNQRSVWKAMRLQLYIEQRLEEYKKGLLGKKAWYWKIINDPDFYKTYKILEYRNTNIQVIKKNLDQINT